MLKVCILGKGTEMKIVCVVSGQINYTQYTLQPLSLLYFTSKKLKPIQQKQHLNISSLLTLQLLRVTSI